MSIAYRYVDNILNTSKNVKLHRYCLSEILYNFFSLTKNTEKTNDITTRINYY